MKNIYPIIVILLLVAGGGSFFGGMKYQESKQPQFFRQLNGGQGNRAGAGQFQGNRTGSRPVAGEIINTDDKSMTVKLQDGSSKIVILSDKTQISEATQAAKADLIVGQKVAVFGTDNSDGSVTAGNIQLNPENRNGIGQPRN